MAKAKKSTVTKEVVVKVNLYAPIPLSVAEDVCNEITHSIHRFLAEARVTIVYCKERSRGLRIRKSLADISRKQTRLRRLGN